MTKVQQLLPSKKTNKTGQIPMEIHMPCKPGGQKLKLLGI